MGGDGMGTGEWLIVRDYAGHRNIQRILDGFTLRERFASPPSFRPRPVGETWFDIALSRNLHHFWILVFEPVFYEQPEQPYAVRRGRSRAEENAPHVFVDMGKGEADQ
jgi:hypothetical protein